MEGTVSSSTFPVLPPTLKHLTPPERAALGDFLARLREQYADEVVSVRLFGSRARGEGGPESDLDVLVVMRSEDWRAQRQVGQAALQPMLDYNVVISTLVVGQRHYRKLARRHTPLYENVRDEGVSLWTPKTRRTSLGT
jgi:predicted nucleotidyltransferase